MSWMLLANPSWATPSRHALRTFISIKNIDKIMLGKNLEIEWFEFILCIKILGKSGFFGRKHPFNIFSVAFIGDGCRIHSPRRVHLSGAEVSEIMLKCHISKRWTTPLLGKCLAFNTLRNAPKIAYFRPKDFLFGKPPVILRHFMTFSWHYSKHALGGGWFHITPTKKVGWYIHFLS